MFSRYARLFLLYFSRFSKFFNFKFSNDTIVTFSAYAVAKTNHEVPEHLACFVAAHAGSCSTSRDEMSDDIDDTFLDLSDFEDEAEN